MRERDALLCIWMWRLLFMSIRTQEGNDSIGPAFFSFLDLPRSERLYIN